MDNEKILKELAKQLQNNIGNVLTEALATGIYQIVSNQVSNNDNDTRKD